MYVTVSDTDFRAVYKSNDEEKESVDDRGVHGIDHDDIESHSRGDSADGYGSENDDAETTVDNKDKEDWLSLSENQKFHAVSNALYNLDQQRYTITESEHFILMR